MRRKRLRQKILGMITGKSKKILGLKKNLVYQWDAIERRSKRLKKYMAERELLLKGLEKGGITKKEIEVLLSETKINRPLSQAKLNVASRKVIRILYRFNIPQILGIADLVHKLKILDTILIPETRGSLELAKEKKQTIFGEIQKLRGKKKPYKGE